MKLIEDISLVLGRRSPRREILSSAALVVITFFYIYTVTSFLDVEVFLLQNRVTYDFVFEIYLINPFFDHLVIDLCTFVWLGCSLINIRSRLTACILFGVLVATALGLGNAYLLEMTALSSVPIILGFLFYNYVLRTRTGLDRAILAFDWNVYMTHLSIFAIYIGIVSTIESMAPLISSNVPILLGNYVYRVYVAISWLSPLFLIILVCCVPVKLLVGIVQTRLLSSEIQVRGRTVERPKKALGSFKSKHDQAARYGTISFLILLMAMSSALTFIPQTPTVNEGDQIIGVDTESYGNWTNDLLISGQKGPDSLLTDAFLNAGVKGDRPLTFLFLIFVINIAHFPNLLQAIDSLPVLLAPLLVLATFFMAKQMTLNNRISILAAFMTAVSFQVLVGIYAGYYANWFALIIGYFCFGFLFRFLRNASKGNFSAFLGLLVAMLFAHVYTWSVLTVVMGVFLIVMFRVDHFSKKIVRTALIAVLFVVALDIAKSAMTGANSGVGEDVKIAVWGIGLGNFVERWNTLIEITHDSLGGLFGNSIVLLLGIYWLIRSNYREPSNILLFIFLSVGLIPLFFGNWLVLSRVIYNIPFQLPAAVAMEHILRRNNQVAKVATYPLTGLLINIAICLWLTSISIILLSDFSAS